MPRDAPTCRRCGAPAAGVVSVAELDGSRAQRAVGEWALCGECLQGVAEAVGFERQRLVSTREVVGG